MAKNFFKTIFNSNKDKNNISKNPKLSPNYKLSDLVKNTEDSKILQQQQTFDSYNTLLNYYIKKDDNNNIINSFLEKISKLNNKFYTSSKEFIITKTSFDKLSDELFLNLFKQIDCYVEEIQRLNKKISSLDNKDNKLIIKNLSKELTEKKEKLRNCEIKLREKTTKEEKLLKEIESYKRRIIFFKNKININLMARNRYQRDPTIKIKSENTNNYNTFLKKISKNYEKCSSKGSILKKDKRDFFSPSPGKNRTINNGLGYLSSKNSRRFALRSSMHQVRRKIDPNIINNIDTLGNSTANNFSISLRTISGVQNDTQNVESGNIETKSKGIFSEEEEEDCNKQKIKINRSMKPKESIIIPYNKNNNKDDDNLETIGVEKINDEDNFDKDINKNINIDENKKENVLSPKENFGLKIYSPEIKPKPFEKNFTEQNLLNSDKEENDPKKKEDNLNYKSNKKVVSKFSVYSSAFDIKNKNKTDKKKNEIVINPKIQKWKTNTTKKSSGVKKVFNYPQKKFLIPSPKTLNKFNTSNNTGKNSLNNSYNNTATQFYSNKNINNSLNNDVSNKFNTIDNNSNNNNGKNNPLEKLKKSNTIGSEIENKEEILEYKSSKCRTVRFKQDDISEKEQKYQFTTFESENCEISSKELPPFIGGKKTASKSVYKKINKASSGNNSDTLSKGTINNENSSCGDNSSLILKKEKKVENNRKSLISSQSFRNKSKKQKINKNTKDMILDLKNKQKEKELGKILKEMNEDYNNDIEMLNRQEEQIKFMLNLIDLNDSSDS